MAQQVERAIDVLFGENAFMSAVLLNPEETAKGKLDCKRIEFADFSRVEVPFYRNGEVTLKRGVLNDRKVVIKSAPSQNSSEELKLMSEMRHKNMVPLIGHIKTPGELHLVMPEAEYGSLDKHKHQVADWSWEVRCKLLLQIADVMEYLHNNNILYRDLKPGNILISMLDIKYSQITVMLTDFNISREVEGRPLTKGIGTFGYTAPEAFSSDYTNKCDVFSFAMVMFFLLEGKHPYEAMREVNHRTNLLQMAQLYLENVRPAYNQQTDNQGNSHDFIDLMRSCWSTSPDLRPSFTDVKNHPVFRAVREDKPIVEIDHNQLLGSGSSADVYKGSWNSNLAAFKKIRGSSDLPNKELADVKREVEALRWLCHPNIVKYFGYYEKENIYIVTEFLDGGSLIKCFHVLSMEQAMEYGYQLACGLEYMHAMGYVHNDPKLNNILLRGNARNAVWVDLGSAYHYISSQLSTRPSAVPNSIMRSPSLIEGNAPKPADDVFSFGILLLQLVSKKLNVWEPLQLDVAILDAIKVGKRPSIPHECPKQIKEIIRDCWMQQGRNRPQMKHVASRLQKFYKGYKNPNNNNNKDT